MLTTGRRHNVVESQVDPRVEKMWKSSAAVLPDIDDAAALESAVLSTKHGFAGTVDCIARWVHQCRWSMSGVPMSDTTCRLAALQTFWARTARMYSSPSSPLPRLHTAHAIRLHTTVQLLLSMSNYTTSGGSS